MAKRKNKKILKIFGLTLGVVAALGATSMIASAINNGDININKYSMNRDSLKKFWGEKENGLYSTDGELLISFDDMNDDTEENILYLDTTKTYDDEKYNEMVLVYNEDYKVGMTIYEIDNIARSSKADVISRRQIVGLYLGDDLTTTTKLTFTIDEDKDLYTYDFNEKFGLKWAYYGDQFTNFGNCPTIKNSNQLEYVTLSKKTTDICSDSFVSGKVEGLHTKYLKQVGSCTSIGFATYYVDGECDIDYITDLCAEDSDYYLFAQMYMVFREYDNGESFWDKIFG